MVESTEVSILASKTRFQFAEEKQNSNALKSILRLQSLQINESEKVMFSRNGIREKKYFVTQKNIQSLESVRSRTKTENSFTQNDPERKKH